MLGISVSLSNIAVRGRGTPAPTPTPAVTSIVIEGDSITFAGGPGNGGFAWQYAAAPPAGKSVTVNAENSRTVGGGAYNGENADGGTPAGNTMAAHASDDIATGAQLIAAMIGTNDLAAFQIATYRSRLIDLGAVYHAAGRKFAWSPPIPMCTNKAYNNSVPGGYEAFTAKRVALMATARDPAVWGLFADYYIPLGEQPDFNAADNTALIDNTDGVHPTNFGQNTLLTVVDAAIDTLFDAAAATSTSMANAAWPVSETNLVASTQVTRRFVVRGIAHQGLALGCAISGGGSPQLRINNGVWTGIAGTDSNNGYRIYNGDTIDFRLTTAGAAATDTNVSLRVGSETRNLTYRTVAAVAAATYQQGDIEGSTQTGQTHVYPSRNFVSSGVAVIGVNWNENVTGVKVGGVAATRHIHQIGGYGAVMLDVWVVPVAAGARDIEVMSSKPAAGTDTVSVISWGVVVGADAAPLATVTANDADTVNLATPPITVPAAGIAIGFFGEYAGGSSVAAATISASNGGTTAIDEGQAAFQGEAKGIALATRTATGPFSWDFPGGGYGPHPRAALAFKASGT